MKIIDKTPFFNERGEISLTNRARAVMKFGRSWLSEMEAQKSVMPVFEKNLDRKFTLLRNVSLPVLDAPIPFILIGPPGVFVIYITDLVGMFRAKGDLWATVSGNALKPEKVNLLTRTEQLAQVVHIHLQRQGFKDIASVEAILLCANPAIHVDSVRPIIRVVMRDALERFTISLSEAIPLLTLDKVHRITDLITINTPEKEEQPGKNIQEDVAVAGRATVPGISPALPVAVEPEKRSMFRSITDPAPVATLIPIQPEEVIPHQASEELPSFLTELIQPAADPRLEPPRVDEGPVPPHTAEKTGFEPSTGIPPADPPLEEVISSLSGLIPLPSDDNLEAESSALPESLFPRNIGQPAVLPIPTPEPPKPPKKKGFSRNQWLILAGMALIWVIMAVAFLFFILKDLVK